MAKTQMEVADSIRAQYKEHFALLVVLKDRLEKLLDESQNPPPHGGSDGSIGEAQYNQLRSIAKATRGLLVALLFDTQSREAR
jgi:hypothetical protein